jgi:hypothetical protein
MVLGRVTADRGEDAGQVLAEAGDEYESLGVPSLAARARELVGA